MPSPSPKPAALKLVEGRGNGTDSGGRKVKPPPAFVRLPPTKPEGMSLVAGELWDQFVGELQRLQLTKPLDGPALEMGCETYARWHEARKMRLRYGMLENYVHGQRVAPWVGIEERASKEFRAWAGEFGLTPSAEARLSVGDGGSDGDSNPFGA